MKKVKMLLTCLCLLVSSNSFAREYGSPLPNNIKEFKENSPLEKANQLYQIAFYQGHDFNVFKNIKTNPVFIGQENFAIINTCEADQNIKEFAINLKDYFPTFQNGLREQLDCRNMPIAKDFIVSINTHLFSCIDEAFISLGYSSVDKIIINGSRLYDHQTVDQKLSLHATARSLNIRSIDLTSEDRFFHLDTSSRDNETKLFYTEINNCWIRKTAKNSKCLFLSTNQDDYQYDIDEFMYKGSYHLSLPYCFNDGSFLNN